MDDMENSLKEKIGVKTSFSDSEVQARRLSKIFQFFDVNDNGVIDFEEFFAAMTSLNFIGEMVDGRW